MDRQHAGFTLVEVAVVMVIAAILASMALPSFAHLAREHQVATVVNQLLASLAHTRSEAIKRGRRATACTSSDQSICAAGIGWHSGWIVFDDPNANAQRDEGEAILHAVQGRGDGVVATGNVWVANYVSYLAGGRTATTSGALQMGTITACKEGVARQIVISATGRPRLVRPDGC
jgi:type IV fimbrial biogenesis protein FimT